jgi:hypothetical protein
MSSLFPTSNSSYGNEIDILSCSSADVIWNRPISLTPTMKDENDRTNNKHPNTHQTTTYSYHSTRSWMVSTRPLRDRLFNTIANTTSVPLIAYTIIWGQRIIILCIITFDMPIMDYEWVVKIGCMLYGASHSASSVVVCVSCFGVHAVSCLVWCHSVHNIDFEGFCSVGCFVCVMVFGADYMYFAGRMLNEVV